MDELVANVANAAGLDPATARKAVVIILQFLVNAGPRDNVAGLVDALPGAREALGNAGGGPADLMSAFGALTGAGLGMGEVQSAATAFGKAARDKVGPENFDSVVASVPGLSQFV